MSISLDKRTEEATISLTKALQVNLDKGNDLGAVSAQVILAIDYSGSMSARYANNEVQELAERALALSIGGLDDDGTVPVFFFNDGTYPTEMVTAANYAGFVDNWRQNKRMGGTQYGRTIEQIVSYLAQNGGLAPGLPPVFVIFITDGAPNDRTQTKELLIRNAGQPIFWQFLGLGYEPAFLKELDEMEGRIVDNVGLTVMNDTLGMTDGEFFDAILEEFFGSYLTAARSAGVITN